MKPTLALSLIVRDAAADLAKCLASVEGVVDEIVVADTGSRDDSIAVARRHGARVIPISWDNDFAAARNAALAECRADWVLSLDADQRLDPAAGPILRGLMAQPSGPPGYQASIRNYVLSARVHMYAAAAKPNDFRLEEARPYPAYVEHENALFFRRRPDIYFVGRVHETTARCIEALCGQVGPPCFIVHHFTFTENPETRRRKDLLYRELGRQKLAERPDDPRSYLELGAEELEHFSRPAEALQLFRRACALSPTFWLAWYYQGLAQLRLGHPREALAAFTTAREGGLIGAYFDAAAGEAHYALGEFAAAARGFRRALKGQPDSATFASQLAMSEIRGGEAETGLKRLRRAARAEPEHGEVHDRLVTALAWLGEARAAAEAAERWLARFPAPHPRPYLRAASLRAHEGQWRLAAQVLQQGLCRFPADAGLQAAWSEVQPHLSGPLAQKPRPSA
ncbi:MAG: glycosyltransferase [Terriglobales bacterium]